MRQKIKEQLLHILDSMNELQGRCMRCQAGQLPGLMEDCQQAAIAVGETIEWAAPKEKETVSWLEKYCEIAYEIAEKQQVVPEQIDDLTALTGMVRNRLEELPKTYQVVFFPYKAEMWDSLESIWRACQADERCECLVVPVPYFGYDASQKQMVSYYDGGNFPKEVPVVPYTAYSLKDEQPELAYVHNPYDGGNLVTSVHPHFYSAELKKYVKKLVYVPYYVTTGQISKEHLLLPVHLHMDYMIVQSEHFKSGCKDMFYYDKVLPLGSPKLDKVIRLCQKKGELPKEWKDLLTEKKSLMLNTSLNCLLQQGELYLRKLKHLFEWICDHKETAIVWRPHPLLETTMKAMRTALLSEYYELVDYFEKNQIGVLDRTPDISATVALVDGYIGEEPTSIVNLFGAVGKPLFILNNFILDGRMKERKRTIRIADMCYAQGKWWLISSLYNGLFSVGQDWEQIVFEGRIEGQPKWYGTYSFLGAAEDKLYLSPDVASAAVSYRIKERIFDSLPVEQQETGFLHYRQVIPYKGSVFFLPNGEHGLLEYCPKSGGWKEHGKCMTAFREGLKPETYQAYSSTCDCAREGKWLFITAVYTNRILCFDMENGTYRIEQIGEEGWGYSGIVKSDDFLWLAEIQTGKVLRKNLDTGESRIYEMPLEFQCRQHMNGNYLAHRALFDMGDSIVTAPALSNAMIRIDKVSGEAALCVSSFWADAEKEDNDYYPPVHFSCCFAGKLDDERMLVQRTRDDALAIVNVKTDEYEIYYPTMSGEAYEEFMRGQDGFERPDGDYFAFARRESRLFSLEDFLGEMTEGRLDTVKERQLSELSDFAANLDGTCGEKVHAYMMDVLSGTSI